MFKTLAGSLIALTLLSGAPNTEIQTSPTVSSVSAGERTVAAVENIEKEVISPSPEYDTAYGVDSSDQTLSSERVQDNAGVFTEQDMAQLEDAISTAEEQHNIHFVVETIGTLHGQDIEDYATQRHAAYQYGTEDRTMLYVIAVNDQEYYTTLGYNITHIDSSDLDAILEDVLPSAFRDAQYADGILESFDMVIAGDVPDSSTVVVIFTILFSLAMFFLPFLVPLAIITFIIFAIRKTHRQNVQSHTYVPTDKAKAEIATEVQRIYDEIHLSYRLRDGFATAEGKDGRTQMLLEHDVIKAVEDYTLYMDRLLIAEHYDSIVYNPEDSLEFLNVRNKAYQQDIDNGAVTAQHVLQTMSVEEKILFQGNKNRTSILTQRAYGFETQEDIQKSLKLEREMLELLQHDTELQHFREQGIHFSRGGDRHHGRHRGIRSSSRSRSSSSRSSSSSRGAGGRW